MSDDSDYAADCAQQEVFQLLDQVEELKVQLDAANARCNQLNSALWELAGKAARLEFGNHEHIDRLQTAVYAETLQPMDALAEKVKDG